MIKSYKLAAAHIGVGIAAFAVASLMGVLQGLSVADVNFPQRSESLYYLSVTAHGVLMALVFTTFFIAGFCTPVDDENCQVYFWRCRKVEGWARDTWKFMYRNRPDLPDVNERDQIGRASGRERALRIE